MLDTFLLVLLMGVLNLLAFLIGAKTAQKVSNNEPIELPKVNPLEIYREHKEQVAVAKEQEKLNTMLGNIDNYTGDGSGQKDI